MEKLKSSLTNMVAVLTVIAVIAGAALAAVNAVTEPKINELKEASLQAGIRKVLGIDPKDELSISKTDTLYQKGKEKTDGNIQYIRYKTENGIAISSVCNGFGGPLKVLVGFDAEGNIKGYTVLEHAETPGLGAKAQEWFQDKIIGKNPGSCNFTVSKDGGDIDAITASTITSRAFLTAIQNAYNNRETKETDAKSGATSQAKGEGDCCKKAEGECGKCPMEQAECGDCPESEGECGECAEHKAECDKCPMEAESDCCKNK